MWLSDTCLLCKHLYVLYMCVWVCVCVCVCVWSYRSRNGNSSTNIIECSGWIWWVLLFPGVCHSKSFMLFNENHLQLHVLTEQQLHCKTFRCKFTVKYWQLGCQPHTVFLQDYYCKQHLQFCTVFTKYSIILLYNIFYSIRLLFTGNIVIPAFLSVLLHLQI